MWNALNCWCHLFKEVKTAVRCKGRERVVTKSGNQPVNRGQRIGGTKQQSAIVFKACL